MNQKSWKLKEINDLVWSWTELILQAQDYLSSEFYHFQKIWSQPNSICVHLNLIIRKHIITTKHIIYLRFLNQFKEQVCMKFKVQENMYISLKPLSPLSLLYNASQFYKQLCHSISFSSPAKGQRQRKTCTNIYQSWEEKPK